MSLFCALTFVQMSSGLRSTVTLADIRAAFKHQIDVYGAVLPADGHEPAVPTGNRGEPTSAIPESTIKQKTIEPPVKETTGTPAAPAADSRSEARSPSIYDGINQLIPAESPIRKLEDLGSLEAYVRDTVLIPLDETRLNPVFGVGNADADLMVIGEAPGADEDKKGEPFVGRAGQLLTKILAAIGFDRSDVYIANILKSRPPDNRNPTPEEVAAHIPILYRQISLIRPVMLLCVGKTSGTSLLKMNASLGSMRGRFQDFHGLPVMVTYHPAALLRNPNWKRPTWEDMQMVRDRYQELHGKPGSVKTADEADD